MQPDFPALWWTQTTFGTIVIVMFFLTWGLIIINLALAGSVMLNKMFTQPKDKQSKKPSKN
jgi:hypothetical protein